MGKKLTTESMIERFRSRHGDTYDYSNVDSDSRDEKGRVRIICPIHGEFLQTPMNHIRGKGCPLCFGTHKKDTNDVISEIKSMYGDKYIIPNDFVYINNKASFNMICKKHGEWSTTYSRLITKGCGCKKCSCTIYDTELFIRKISEIYGESFNYDELEFNGFRNKVTVKCKECGKKLFFSPSVLLNGTATCDCSTKKQSKLEIDIDNALKTNGLEYIPQYKASWLRLIEPLSLDFYIPSVKMAIECQGRMHFEPFKKNDRKSAEYLLRQVERDKEKYRLCEEHGIKLLYYSDIKYDGEYMDEIHDSIDEIIKIIKLNNT